MLFLDAGNCEKKQMRGKNQLGRASNFLPLLAGVRGMRRLTNEELLVCVKEEELVR